jgi:hypothetical protein
MQQPPPARLALFEFCFVAAWPGSTPAAAVGKVTAALQAQAEDRAQAALCTSDLRPRKVARLHGLRSGAWLQSMHARHGTMLALDTTLLLAD